MKETIFALSTVPGQSAIAVVRISGPNAFLVLRKFVLNSLKKFLVLMKYLLETQD